MEFQCVCVCVRHSQAPFCCMSSKSERVARMMCTYIMERRSRESVAGGPIENYGESNWG